jgi:putative ABC transport system permease protein
MPSLKWSVSGMLVVLSAFVGQSLRGQADDTERGKPAGSRASAARDVDCIVLRSVRPREPAPGDKGALRGVAYGLRYHDYERILAAVPTIRRAAPVREFPAELRHRDRVLQGQVVATTADYAVLDHLELARGRFLTDQDNTQYENVAVLGAEAARLLFPGEGEDPIGQAVRVGGGYYTVVGILNGRQSSLDAESARQDIDEAVFLPLNTCRLRFGERILRSLPGGGPVEAEEVQLTRIVVQVDDVARVRGTAAVLEATVKAVHPDGDVEVIGPQDAVPNGDRIGPRSGR